MSNIDEELLAFDPESSAVEADENASYTPSPSEDDQVIVLEPEIITIGRKKRRDALRNMQSTTE